MFFALVLNGQAAVINAASPALVDVQKAIASAASGDTVAVPAGTASWTSMLTLSGKVLTLQGAGIDLTTVTDVSSGQHLIDVVCTAATQVRITGFTFVKSAAHTEGMLFIEGTKPGGNDEVGFRIDHNKLLFPSVGGRGIEPSGIFGLIDHNQIVVKGGGSQQTVSVVGSSIALDGGFTPWTHPLTLGTNHAVYIEDNVFDYTANDQAEDAIDAVSGARLVVRYNTFLSISQGFHGTDSGNIRSPHSFEVYNNTYTNNSKTKIRYLTVRGGTGVVFNNTYGGTIGSWNGITLQYYRAYSAMSNWQQSTGAVWQLGASDPATNGSRTCSLNGGFGFNSIDKETLGKWGSSFQRGFDGTGPNGYPGRDQPGISTGQVSEPIYTWNNGPEVPGTWAGGAPADEALLKTFIQQGRDYILGQRPNYKPFTYPYPWGTPPPPVVVPPSTIGITWYSPDGAVTGSRVDFTSSAGAGSTPFTYQWEKNGIPILGATSATYTISKAQVSDNGNYFVVVSNSAGSAESMSLSLVVAPPPITPKVISTVVSPDGLTITLTFDQSINH